MVQNHVFTGIGEGSGLPCLPVPAAETHRPGHRTVQPRGRPEGRLRPAGYSSVPRLGVGGLAGLVGRLK